MADLWHALTDGMWAWLRYFMAVTLITGVAYGFADGLVRIKIAKGKSDA